MRPLGYGWVTTGTEIRLLRRQESAGLAAGRVLVPECRNRPKAGGRSVWYPCVHATGRGLRRRRTGRHRDRGGHWALPPTPLILVAPSCQRPKTSLGRPAVEHAAARARRAASASARAAPRGARLGGGLVMIPPPAGSLPLAFPPPRGPAPRRAGVPAAPRCRSNLKLGRAQAGKADLARRPAGGFAGTSRVPGVRVSEIQNLPGH